MEPMLGEIRMFSWPTAPQGWAPCDGAILSVQQHQALFSLLGVKFGGDGKKTFALPDLRGRAVVGAIAPRPGRAPKLEGRTTYKIGETTGSEGVTLTLRTMPAHIHTTNVADKPVGTSLPKGALFGKVAAVGSNPTINIYAEASSPLISLDEGTIGPTGGGEAHVNMQPFATIGYCIATIGEYPPRQDR